MAVMSPQHVSQPGPLTATTAQNNHDTSKQISTLPSSTDEDRSAENTTNRDIVDRSITTAKSLEASISSPPHSSPIDEIVNGSTTVIESAPVTTNGNGTYTDAPPSPIPTPPLQVTTDMVNDHPGLSELSIKSPPPPTTATPAFVDQIVSNVRSSPQPMEVDTAHTSVPEIEKVGETNVSMTEVEPVVEEAPAVVETPVAPLVEEAKSEDVPQASAPAVASTDAEMADAPAVPEPVKAAAPAVAAPVEAEQLAGRVRARSPSMSDERPMKRVKSEEALSPTDQTMTDAPFSASAFSALGAQEEPMTKPRRMHCSEAIRAIKRTKDAVPFLNTVDAIKLNIPTYYDIVTNPMTLAGIEKNLKGDYYPTVDSFVTDFRQIITNTVLFNGPENPITLMGKRMEENFNNRMSKLPPADKEDSGKSKKKTVPPVPKTRTVTPSAVPSAPPTPAAEVVKPVPVVKAEPAPAQTPALPKVDTKSRRESTRGNAKSPITTAGSPTFSLNPSGMPLIRRDSVATLDGRPKRPIHPPPPRDLPYSDLKPRRKKAVAELKWCEGIVKEFYKKQHEGFAYPFYHPVDPVALNIPDYFKIIKKPMDIETVQTKLKQNEYDGSADFEADVRLMFSNCFKFNPPDSTVWDMGKRLEAVFEDKWRDKPNFKAEQSESASPMPEEDMDEEMASDDDGEGEQDDKVIALQQQVEQMQKELERMQKSKKGGSPPAANRHKKRASLSQASAPAPKKAATGNKKSGGGGTKKSKKDVDVPYITFEQKQELSERINNLSQGKLALALAMIREEMPGLNDNPTEEIELDIDDLSPAVLHKLYNFVAKNTTAPKNAQPPIAPPPKERHSEKQRSVPKVKKNKPMSATEQERQIRELKAKVEQFDSGEISGPRSLASMNVPAAADESSSDDESSSGSESEEE